MEVARLTTLSCASASVTNIWVPVCQAVVQHLHSLAASLPCSHAVSRVPVAVQYASAKEDQWKTAQARTYPPLPPGRDSFQSVAPDALAYAGSNIQRGPLQRTRFAQQQLPNQVQVLRQQFSCQTARHFSTATAPAVQQQESLANLKPYRPLEKPDPYTESLMLYNKPPPNRFPAWEEPVVPAEIKGELTAIYNDLWKKAQKDGRARWKLSTSTLPFEIPKHDIEEGLPVVKAIIREIEGRSRTNAKWVQRAGRTPACLVGFPGRPGSKGQRKINIHMDSNELQQFVSKYGRNGCEAVVVRLDLVEHTQQQQVLASIRCKPIQVQMRATSLDIEHISFNFLPRNKVVDVNLCIRLSNEDIAIGGKNGGWYWIKKRVISYEALGHSIPPYIELDVAGMDVGDVIRVKDLPIPPGTRLPKQDFDAIVVECTKETTWETRGARLLSPEIM